MVLGSGDEEFESQNTASEGTTAAAEHYMTRKQGYILRI